MSTPVVLENAPRPMSAKRSVPETLLARADEVIE
jgi:hypothetical protein